MLADCPLTTTGASPLRPGAHFGTPAPPLASSEAAECKRHPRTPRSLAATLCVGCSRPRAPRPGKAPPRGTKEAARAPHSPARFGAAGVLPGRACAAPEPRPELPPARVPQPRGRQPQPERRPGAHCSQHLRCRLTKWPPARSAAPRPRRGRGGAADVTRWEAQARRGLGKEGETSEVAGVCGKGSFLIPVCGVCSQTRPEASVEGSLHKQTALVL